MANEKKMQILKDAKVQTRKPKGPAMTPAAGKYEFVGRDGKVLDTVLAMGRKPAVSRFSMGWSLRTNKPTPPFRVRAV